jgi:hypothetical protein
MQRDAHVYAAPRHVVRHGSLKGCLRRSQEVYRGRFIQDAGYGLCRMHLPRTRVHRVAYGNLTLGIEGSADSPHHCPMDVRGPKGELMGINRWSDIEERKRNETDAKAGEEVPKGNKGDASSRLQASEEPAEDKEKRQVLEKLKKRERES